MSLSEVSHSSQQLFRTREFGGLGHFLASSPPDLKVIAYEVLRTGSRSFASSFSGLLLAGVHRSGVTAVTVNCFEAIQVFPESLARLIRAIPSSALAKDEYL